MSSPQTIDALPFNASALDCPFSSPIPIAFLALGPHLYRVIVALLFCVAPFLFRVAWNALPAARRGKAVIHVLKCAVYILIFAATSAYFPDLFSTWGDFPLWTFQSMPRIVLVTSVEQIAILYGFQLVYSPHENWDVWLHHLASSVLVVCAILSPYVLHPGDVAVLYLFGLTWSWSLSLLLFLHAVMTAYHLCAGLDNEQALKFKYYLAFTTPFLWIPSIIVMDIFPIVVAASHRHLLDTPGLQVLCYLFPVVLFPEQILSCRTLILMALKARKAWKQHEQRSHELSESKFKSYSWDTCAREWTSRGPWPEDGSGLSQIGKALAQDGFRAGAHVEEKYSQWAKTYDADSFRALGFASPEVCVESVLRVWPRGPESLAMDVTVIDAGCGTGKLAELVCQRLGGDAGAVFYGIDLTEAMLEQARPAVRGCTGASS